MRTKIVGTKADQTPEVVWKLRLADEHGPDFLVALDHGSVNYDGTITFPEDWRDTFLLDFDARRMEGYPMTVHVTGDFFTAAEAIDAVAAATAKLWAPERFAA